MGIKCFGHKMKAKAFIMIRREKYMVCFTSQHLRCSINGQNMPVWTPQLSVWQGLVNNTSSSK